MLGILYSIYYHSNNALFFFLKKYVHQMPKRTYKNNNLLLKRCNGGGFKSRVLKSHQMSFHVCNAYIFFFASQASVGCLYYIVYIPIYTMLKTLYTLTHGGGGINDVFGFPSKIGFHRFYIRLPVSWRWKKVYFQSCCVPRRDG